MRSVENFISHSTIYSGTCEICKNAFYTTHRKSSGNCSLKCARLFNRKRIYVKCIVCKKIIWRFLAEAKRNRTNNFFCSPKCQHSYWIGKNHPAWNGGWITNSGYKEFNTNSKRFRYHRYIMEKHIGRKLKSFEVVHHMNHDRLDNRIENLEIMSKSDHSRYHNLSR